MKRTVDEFLKGFVLPLVAGGDMHVGRPISEPELQVFIDQLPHASVASVAVDDARSDVIARLVVRAPAQLLDDDELYLAAALHNLLCLSHPDIERWSVTRAMERRVLDTAQAFARRPMSTQRRRVLSRHGLLHQVFAIGRADLTVKWWTGSATFLGREAPRRLMRWRSLRRVGIEHTRADFGDLLASQHVLPVLDTLLRRSPLTLLLCPVQLGAALHWEELTFVLRDPELARAVAYAAVDGSTPDEMVAAPASYASAFEQMLERHPSPADVRAVAAFLVHLCALFALAEADARDTRRSALLNAVLAAPHRPKGLATLFALPAALRHVAPHLAEPPGLSADERVHRRWLQHREQAAAELGDGVASVLVNRLSRHLGAPMAEATREPGAAPADLA